MNGYTTEYGECICGDSLVELAKLPDNSINLVVTSPPFALQRKKAYGNEEQENYVDWLCQFAALVYKKLRDDGSFVIDIGGAYEKGLPSYSLYQFRVLIKMVDDLPDDLLAVVVTQIDPMVFAEVLSKNFQDILAEIGIGNV